MIRDFTKKYTDGSIVDRLKELIKDYSGPIGQSMSAMAVRDAKVKILKDCVDELVENEEVLRVVCAENADMLRKLDKIAKYISQYSKDEATTKPG